MKSENIPLVVFVAGVARRSPAIRRWKRRSPRSPRTPTHATHSRGSCARAGEHSKALARNSTLCSRAMPRIPSGSSASPGADSAWAPARGSALPRDARRRAPASKHLATRTRTHRCASRNSPPLSRSSRRPPRSSRKPLSRARGRRRSASGEYSSSSTQVSATWAPRKPPATARRRRRLARRPSSAQRPSARLARISRSSSTPATNLLIGCAERLDDAWSCSPSSDIVPDAEILPEWSVAAKRATHSEPRASDSAAPREPPVIRRRTRYNSIDECLDAYSVV